MKKNLIILFTISFIVNTYSQSIYGKFNIPRQIGKQVNLYRTEGNYAYIIDSTRINSQSSFFFKFKKYPIGYYKIGLINDKNTIDIILNSVEEKLSLEFNKPKLEDGVKILISNENSALREFKAKDNVIQNQIKNFKRQRGQARKEGNDIKVNELSNKISQLEKDLSNFTTALVNKNPNTFFSKTQLATSPKFPEDKFKYFSDLDFNNESFIRSKVYSKRFQDYIIKHSGHTESGYYNAVDEIMNKAKSNEKVFEFALYNLLDGFYGSGLEDVATYIMEEYFYGEACGEIQINDLLKQKAKLFKNLQIGNIPPDFTIKNNLGSLVNLKNTCKQNIYTIVMFWATHCPHCMRDLPGFVSVYNEYKTKGLEVIGVALDVNREKWNKVLNEKKFNWINVSQFKNYDSPVCKDYKINKTPTYFILDNNMKIVSKPRGKSELMLFLKNNMK